MTRGGRPTRPAEVRYHADADIIGLAKILAAIRTDTTYPGDPVKGRRYRPPCPIIDPRRPRPPERRPRTSTPPADSGEQLPFPS